MEGGRRRGALGLRGRTRRDHSRGTPPPDPWDVLGLPHGEDSKRAIKKAYRKLSLRYHPDKQRSKGGDADGAAAKFIQVNEAYRTLSDPIAMDNYRRYGNPDGPRWRREMPLPAFLDSNNTDPTVLLFIYAVAILGLPGCLLLQAKRCRRTNKGIGNVTDASLQEDREWLRERLSIPAWQTLLAAGGGAGALEVLARCPGVARAASESATGWGGDAHLLGTLFAHDKMKAAGLGRRTGESLLPNPSGAQGSGISGDGAATASPTTALGRSLALVLLQVHTSRLSKLRRHAVAKILGEPLVQRGSDLGVSSETKCSDKASNAADAPSASASTSTPTFNLPNSTTTESGLLAPVLRVCHSRLQVMLEIAARFKPNARTLSRNGLQALT